MTTLKPSHHFADLLSSYNAELDDLRTDSEGNNVLKARLAKKREQVPQLLMMLKFSPEMVAVAFHDAFFFKDVSVLEELVTKKENNFPTWTTLEKAIIIKPWAQTLIDTVLTDSAGETFLITTVGLEYLNKRNQPHTMQASTVAYQEEQYNDMDNNEADLNSEERMSDEGEATEYDLDKAGADWLAEQGFDRKE